jgi:uncharacterized protein YdeI (BOF family)
MQIYKENLLALITSFALMLLLALPIRAQDPYSKPNDTWISINGTVEAVTPNTFLLDYGDGRITVEMDDWDADADGFKLMDGDKVSVFGVIDDDFFETTTIEASSVYVENLGTYFYANSADEEDTFVTISTPLIVSSTTLQGTVTSVNDDQFTLDTGFRKVTIETDQMPYDPLDDEGYQKIKEGHRVAVSGNIDFDLFEGQEFVARSITTLQRDYGDDLSANN